MHLQSTLVFTLQALNKKKLKIGIAIYKKPAQLGIMAARSAETDREYGNAEVQRMIARQGSTPWLPPMVKNDHKMIKIDHN